MVVEAFSKNLFSLRRQSVRISNPIGQTLYLSTNNNAESTGTYQPVFNFATAEDDAVSKFERIDDAIMGGISLSSLKQLPGEDFARWSGICRLDGNWLLPQRLLWCSNSSL
jgi:hypothetical protein